MVNLPRRSSAFSAAFTIIGANTLVGCGGGSSYYVAPVPTKTPVVNPSNQELVDRYVQNTESLLQSDTANESITVSQALLNLITRGAQPNYAISISLKPEDSISDAGITIEYGLRPDFNRTEFSLELPNASKLLLLTAERKVDGSAVVARQADSQAIENAFRQYVNFDPKTAAANIETYNKMVSLPEYSIVSQLQNIFFPQTNSQPAITPSASPAP